MKTLFLSLLFGYFLFPQILEAQTEWDVYFDGKKVKKETRSSYILDDSGNKTNESSSETSYYSNGVIKTETFKSEDYGYDKEYIYDIETRRLLKVFSKNVDGEVTVAVIEEVLAKTFPIREVYFEYDPILETNGKEQYTFVTTYYDNLKPKSSTFTDPYGNISINEWIPNENGYQRSYKSKNSNQNEFEDKTTTVYVYKVLEEDANGWTKRQEVSNGELRVTERRLILFTSSELKDPKNLFQPKQKAEPIAYFLMVALRKHNGYMSYWHESINEEEGILLDRIIAVFESKPESWKDVPEGTDAEYWWDNQTGWQLYDWKLRSLEEQEKWNEAIAVTNRVIEMAKKLGNNDVIDNSKGILARLYENIGDYTKAADYFDKANLQNEPSSIYGYIVIADGAQLFLKANNPEKAEEIIAKTVDFLDEVIVVESDNLMDLRDAFYEIANKTAMVVEELGKLKKAEVYFQIVLDYYKNSWGEDSDYYKYALENLIRVKRAIILQKN